MKRECFALLVALSVLLAGCDDGTQSLTTSPPNPALVDSGGDQSPAASATPTASPLAFYIQPGVPPALASAVAAALTPAGYTQQTTPDGAAARLVLDPGPQAALTAQWVYAVAAPFPTVADDVTWAGLQNYWLTGDPASLPGFESPPALVISTDMADLLIAKLGAPAQTLGLNMVAPDGLSDFAWGVRPSLSILPFDALDLAWKALSVDGLSVLNRSLDVTTYPLTVQVGLIAEGEAGAQAANLIQQNGLWQTTNRDASRITTVAMTGVTALVRATASQMLVKGTDFPAQEILPFLAEADILHTSNEVSFTPKCPAPLWEGPPEDFCSLPDHFSLLQTIGLDIVELTGNHNNDVGTAAFDYSLDLYDQNGIVYYGGGRNLDDARLERILSLPDGTRVALVGCNSAGPFLVWATVETAGAAPCGDWSAIRDQIALLKSSGQAEIVIATVQYQEQASSQPTLQQIADFEALAAAGADIVSGSQAHQPQGFGLGDGAFIHYGMGNLFFDQPELANRQMFIDRHVFYQGRHISTVLFTGVIEYWSQPRPMTPQERADFLRLIFQSSGW